MTRPALDEHRSQALLRAVTHVVGRTRAFLIELESLEAELRDLAGDDRRAARLLDTLAGVNAGAAEPGTVRHVERTATELLRALTGAAAREGRAGEASVARGRAPADLTAMPR